MAQTILTATEFINMGFPISTDVSTEEIELTIFDVENTLIKYKITDINYTELLSHPTEAINYIIINGGIINDVRYSGLKQAIAHIVFAYMLANCYRITRYSSVEKTSEFSKSAEINSMFEQGRRFYDIGYGYIEEVQKYYQLDTKHNDTNSFFETLYF